MVKERTMFHMLATYEYSDPRFFKQMTAMFKSNLPEIVYERAYILREMEYNVFFFFCI